MSPSTFLTAFTEFVEDAVTEVSKPYSIDYVLFRQGLSCLIYMSIALLFKYHGAVKKGRRYLYVTAFFGH